MKWLKSCLIVHGGHNMLFWFGVSRGVGLISIRVSRH